MNVCILSGRLLRNATVKGSEPKTLSFILECRYGYNENEKKDRLAYVPCVLFNPDSATEELLCTRGEGLFLELEGRLSGSLPDANGGRRFNTEVIVKNKSLNLFEPADLAA
jgi:hypothetical protein